MGEEQRHRRQPRHHLIPDILRGAFLGDFAQELGLAGGITQILLGFTPVLGTLLAIRDYLACRRKGDRLGSFLNALTLIPVLGGFSKSAEVIEKLVVGGQGLVIIRGLRRPTRSTASNRPKNGPANFSMATVLLAPSLLLTSIVVVFFMPPLLPGLTVVLFLIPLVAIVSGHLGRRRARKLHKPGSGQRSALVGLLLGYLYLAVSILIVILAVLGINAGFVHP
jgi:hypothetical protein